MKPHSAKSTREILRRVLVMAIAAISVAATPASKVSSTGKKSPEPTEPDVFVDERAYWPFFCITRWEQLCSGVTLSLHQLAFTSSRYVFYTIWPGTDEFTIVVKRRDPRRVEGTLAGAPVVLEKEGTGWKFIGPELIDRLGQIDVAAAGRPRPLPPVTWHFLPKEPLSEMWVRLNKEHLPGGRCPGQVSSVPLPKPGEACLFSSKGWSVMPPLEKAYRAASAGK